MSGCACSPWPGLIEPGARELHRSLAMGVPRRPWESLTDVERSTYRRVVCDVLSKVMPLHPEASVDRGEHTETATRAGEAEAVEAAREALVRNHHELFRAAQRAMGSTPLPYDDLSDRTKRIQHQQLDPGADAAVAAAYPIIAAAVRAECVAELESAATVEGCTWRGDGLRLAAARLARGSSS